MTAQGDSLELHDITKRFGSVSALAGASLVARRGRLHMLLGENGAGKTTLLRIASGLTAADSGSIRLNGRNATWKSRAEALAAGIAVVQQHFSLVPAMTVAENVALARRGLFSPYSPQAAGLMVERVAAEAGLSLDPHAVVGSLSVAAQQRVEIVKAIAHGAPVLILDEPTAVLSPSESEALFTWLTAFAGSGHTVIVITHRIREATQHGNEITVLRHGRTVFSAPGPFADDRQILDAILGEPRPAGGIEGPAPALLARNRSSEKSGVIATLSDVTVVDAGGATKLRNVDCEIRRGEIVGVAGVEGAGHREFLRVIAGRLVPTSGRVSHFTDIGFIPEDRQREALIAPFSLVENFALRGSGAQHGLMAWGRLTAETAVAMKQSEVLADSPDVPARALSGGNQQRFVFARETAGAPGMIVAENPTRGLDVRATAEMIGRLRGLCADGTAIVLYSSDIEELVSLADRVLVCLGGTVREVPVSPGAIGAAMVGAT